MLVEYDEIVEHRHHWSDGRNRHFFQGGHTCRAVAMGNLEHSALYLGTCRIRSGDRNQQPARRRKRPKNSLIFSFLTSVAHGPWRNPRPILLPQGLVAQLTQGANVREVTMQGAGEPQVIALAVQRQWYMSTARSGRPAENVSGSRGGRLRGETQDTQHSWIMPSVARQGRHHCVTTALRRHTAASHRPMRTREPAPSPPPVGRRSPYRRAEV
jgi:hypothetical protein